VPLALVNGTSGIGLGIATLIPAFTLKSVINYVDWLESPAGKNEPELKLNYKSYDMEQTVLDSGYGRIQYKLTFQQEGDKAFVIKNHIPGANVKEILSKLFKTEIEAKKLFIRDESGPSGTRFVVGKIWWVNMQDIEARMKKTSRLITANMNWSTGEDKPLVRRLAPKQVLEICLEKYLEAMEKWRSHELEKIRLEKLFQKIKNIVMKKLIKELSWDAIKSDLSLTQEELSFIRSKTVSQLSKDPLTEKDLDEQTERINSVGKKSATGNLRLI
jgi:DNA gyrase/topoisomerase IV subunit A